MLRHLYHPASGIHYANGGYIPSDTPLPDSLPGAEWIDGPAPDGSATYIELDLASQAKEILMSLPVESRAAHYTQIANIAMAMERDDFEVAHYLLNHAITPQTQAETDVLDAVKTLFQNVLGS